MPTRPPRPPTDEAIDQDRVYERLDYLVNYKGVVTISVPMVHKLFCPMFFRDFPFDTQECTFTVGSWIYNGHEVNILPWTDSDGAGAPVDLSEYELDLEAEFVLKRVDPRPPALSCTSGLAYPPFIQIGHVNKRSFSECSVSARARVQKQLESDLEDL